MKQRITKLYLAFVVLCGALLFASCSKDGESAGSPDDPQAPQAWEIGPMMMLHINTLSYGVQSTGTAVEERIKSLRIIMIHEDPDKKRYLEANRLIDIPDVGADGEGSRATDFTYIFQKRTVLGKKSFYLIANEECAENVTIKGDEGPMELPAQTTLSTLLNSYQPAMPSGKKAAADGALIDPADDDPANPDVAADETAAAQAQEFEKLLQNLCLEPKQELGSGKLYLPYSAYYHSGYDITAAGGHEIDMTGSPMYLVPVATKFTFKFINERTLDNGGLAIGKLELRSTNKTNYLMANFDLSGFKNKEELYLDPVEGGSKQIHWIEWLRQVALATNPTKPEDQTSDNVTDQNSRFGWISCYQMPYPDLKDGAAGESDAVAYDFIQHLPEQSLTLMNAESLGGDKVKSYEQEIGPFYLPEGHHKEAKNLSDDPDSDVTTMVESYGLHIEMYPAGEGASSAQFKEADTEISNLKYLFRNTSIRITIALHEGGVKIYAQTEPWITASLWGYVQDEDDIKQK